MMLAHASGLGLVPSWLYSQDPGVNIRLNPNVSFPDGWSQRTIQPVGSYYGVARIAQPDLGRPSMSRVKRFMTTPLFKSSNAGCCDGGNIPDACCGGDAQVRGLGADSWAYEHRRALLLSGLGLLTAAALGVTAHFIK